MNEDKLWKEKTKLDNQNKFRIILHIAMIILSIVVAIVEKDLTWGLVALLWLNVIVMEYCDTKLMKGKDVVIEIQEEHIKVQNNMIDDLLEKLTVKTEIIEISDIM